MLQEGFTEIWHIHPDAKILTFYKPWLVPDFNRFASRLAR